jgi:transcriptional regulator with XRE-family HTH domain
MKRVPKIQTSPRHPKPNRNEIAIRMISRGITGSQLAREFGVTPQMISRLCRGLSRSKALEEHIEERLGVEPGSLFPHGSEEHENPQEKDHERA